MPGLADKTPAMLLYDYIIADGRATLFTGWEFKFGKLPAEPTQVIAMMDSGGRQGMPNLLVDYLNVQVLIRGSRGGDGYQTSYLMARKVRDILLGIPPRIPQFLELDGITERGTIVALGYDEQDRHRWSCNFQLLVEPEANALTHRTSL